MPHDNAALAGTEYKAMQGQVNIDEAEGIIECFVAGLGNKDSVGDICLPGCFTESLKRRKPRVVWGHNWNEPIGKVIEIYEVGPNDPRLPMKMKRAGIGGLYARVQFNLKSERGRQAFADVAFFGEEQEWSIGYKTLNADYDSQRQANLLREVELYEVSPVLHGANQLTSTISIKSDEQEDAEKGKYPASNYRAQREEDDDSDYTGPRGEDGGVPAANPAMGRQANLAKALAMRFGGAVRLRTSDKNMVIFDHMDKDGNKQTLRVTYHFDGDEFMFGSAVKVKPETVYLNAENDDNEQGMPQRNGNPVMRQYQREMEEYPGLPEGVKPKICKCASCSGGGSESVDIPLNEPSVKAPEAVGIPQENFTGDVLRGYGPRRGNLEALLRYWRPIMKREGGFRRCRVILADHPELYPLERICAWLHHETTGLWPNEGCHHPGMKNCRNKIRGVSNGSIWNEREWNDRLSRIPKGDEKGLDMMEDEDMSSMTPGQIEGKAAEMLKNFLAEQPEFVKYIEDKDNWEHAGDDEKGMIVIHRRNMGDGMGMDTDKGKDDGDCGCGCGGKDKPKPVSALMSILSQLGKSIDEEMQTKAGRMISNRNLQKLQQAMEILQEVVAASASSKEPVVQVKSNGQMRITAPIDSLFSVKTLIDPILEFHEIDSQVDETGIYFSSRVSSEAKSAMINALSAYKELNNKENH